MPYSVNILGALLGGGISNPGSLVGEGIEFDKPVVFDRYNIINQNDLKEAAQKQEKYLQSKWLQF